MNFLSLLFTAAVWASSIIPGYFSEIGSFENEWCGANRVAESLVAQACYGRAKVQGAYSVRAVVFVLKDGTKELHLEKDPPAVELPVLDFSLVGPVNLPAVQPSIGEASLELNDAGEVVGLEAKNTRLGSIRSFRQ